MSFGYVIYNDLIFNLESTYFQFFYQKKLILVTNLMSFGYVMNFSSSNFSLLKDNEIIGSEALHSGLFKFHYSYECGLWILLLRQSCKRYFFSILWHKKFRFYWDNQETYEW